jgi:hypothetical protein
MFSELVPYQLTHELLATLMVEVSGIVNSRLISIVPSDADQPQPLTPNMHMLLTMKTRTLQNKNTISDKRFLDSDHDIIYTYLRISKYCSA